MCLYPFAIPEIKQKPIREVAATRLRVSNFSKKPCAAGKKPDGNVRANPSFSEGNPSDHTPIKPAHATPPTAPQSPAVASPSPPPPPPPQSPPAPAPMASSRWVRPEVYPLFAATGVAVGICAFQLFRNITGNPEVRVSKVGRAAGVLDNHEEGRRYAEHGLRSYVRDKTPEIMPGLNKFFTEPK